MLPGFKAIRKDTGTKYIIYDWHPVGITEGTDLLFRAVPETKDEDNKENELLCSVRAIEAYFEWDKDYLEDLATQFKKKHVSNN